MAKLMKILMQSKSPMYHAVGNHELYNFDWTGLRRVLNIPGKSTVAEEHFYFSFSPMPGWIFLMLNPYEVSLMQERSTEGYREAERLMRKHNPNDVVDGQGNVNYFSGLEGEQQRFVPFNGGFGARQLDWLRQQLKAAASQGDKVVILNHIPLFHEAASWKTVSYDCIEALEVLHEEGASCVVAVFAGHSHKGGYAVDGAGLHHVTVQAPLTHGMSFGCVDVFEDRLELIGQGALPSRTLTFPARVTARARL